MPRVSQEHNMSEILLNSIEEVSVVDVYDLATEIGAECEKIIDLYGAKSVESLIPKCINALELLEGLAVKNERETSLIQELNDRITKLENEKAERAETKKKFEKEIETIEEAWRCETRELVSMVSRLQVDNQRLSQEQQKDHLPSTYESQTESSGFDESLMHKLKEQIDKQRNEIKQKNKELQEKVDHVDQYVVEVEQFKHQNTEVKKRSKLLQNQVKTLCEERADFLAKIQEQHRMIVTMKKQLGISEQEDLEKDDSTTPRFSIAELKEILAERNELKNRINDLEEELLAFKPNEVKHIPKDHEDDAPVQGPLPEEWYTMDDPWKKKNSESGIRKFFKKLFSENNPSFPKRSLSIVNLTKMALSASGPHTDIPI